MRYQNPQLLYFLFAIAVPIIIHLFNFRKHKTIYFSSIRFLKEIKEDNRKRTNLKNLLILLSRILAISFLVFAFSKPYITNNQTNNNTTNNIFIYIDNSFSMDAENENGRLLSVAKEKARSIIKAYPTESNFWLINNDFLSENNNSTNANVIENRIDQITTSAHSKSLKQIINKQTSLSAENCHLFIISDMQTSGLKVKELSTLESSTSLFLVPITSNHQNNISIDTCWTENPLFSNEQERTIFTTISNQSKTDLREQAVFLELNGKQKSQQYINLKGKESKTISFTFTEESKIIQKGVIKINDHPITFDNNYYFTLKYTKQVNVLCINSDNESMAITTLFSNDTSLFNYRNISTKNIDYSALQQQDFIFINEVEKFGSGLINSLNKFIHNGGSVAILPPKNIDLATYNNSLRQLGISTLSKLKTYNTTIDNINRNHPIYQRVFEGKIDKINYPQITKYYEIITQNNSSSIALLTQENKDVFLEVVSKGKGLVYLFNSPLYNKYNNFSKHALFVPTLLNIATSTLRVESIYNIIQPEDFFSSSNIINEKDIVHLKNKKIDIIPTQKTHLGRQVFYTHNQITENGIYSIEVNEEIIDAIAYNYSSLESQGNSISISELEKWKNSISLGKIQIINSEASILKAAITEIQKGKELWKIALILSLLFFAIEILLIKLITS